MYIVFYSENAGKFIGQCSKCKKMNMYDEEKEAEYGKGDHRECFGAV